MTWIGTMPLWLTDVALAIALLLTTELAFRAGRARRARAGDTLQSQLSTVEASTLGMLALILGFTLAMAESRFDGRRQTVIADAAAVGSAYRRAELLPEPERARSRELLRDYVDARRAYFFARPDQAGAASGRAQRLHKELWTRAMAVARVHPDWDVLGVYVEALDDMIRIEAARDIAMASRLPWTIKALLVLVALVAVGLTAFAGGIVGRRSPIVLYVVPMLIAFAFWVIADLDRTRAGLISTGDLPMERLQRAMAAERT